MKKASLLLLLLLYSLALSAQADHEMDNYHRKRLRIVEIGGAAGYAVTLTGLHFLWYQGEDQTSFHWFHDASEWQQVDKAGHFFTAYQISRVGREAFRWAGIRERKAVWLGGLTGILFQTPIEILDGFSDAYGASWPDLIGNMAGAVLFTGQHVLWQEARIHPKFSFYPDATASLRPTMLGKNLLQQSLKNYNGQTYWVSLDIKPWLAEENKFPAWLNVSFGYGAANMVYARKADNLLRGYEPYRQYYLSLDVNFTRIPTRSKLVRSLFFLLNTVKVPAPALEFNRRKGLVVRPLFF